MTKNDNSYKIPCPILDRVVLVRKFNKKDLERKYRDVKKYVNEWTEAKHSISYIVYLVQLFIIDYKELLESLPIIESTESEETRLVFEALYDCILKAYPMLHIEFVCSDINKIKDPNIGGVFLNFEDPLTGAGKYRDALDIIANTYFRNRPEDVSDPNSTGETGPKQLNAKPAPKKKTVKSGLHHLNTLAEIVKLEKYLKSNIIAQDDAIDKLINHVKLITSGLEKRASFFFIGPTGVGKTELSRLFGQKYSGNFYKVNCGEYSGGHEYSKLIGAPPGYVGHSDQNILKEKADKSNCWVFLFDEIEKAHDKFMNFLLALIDEGTVTDSVGNVLDFSESVFIFTSNQGMSDLKLGGTVGFGTGLRTLDNSREEIQRSVKKKFSPEFINRIDEFIHFNGLMEEDAKGIAKLELRHYPMEITDDLLDFIVEGGFSSEYGARNIKRFIKVSVGVPAAEAILNKQIPKKTKGYETSVKKGELKVINTVSYETVQDEIAKQVMATSSTPQKPLK
jgi:SpoVK/Ycf46/Vps4 family AAA+-type ATPase